jgi:Ribonuclease G/E
MRAVEALNARLSADDAAIRSAALGGLSRTCEDKTDRKLLSRDLDDLQPYLDPQEAIDEARVRQAAKKLKIPAEEVRRRYEALAQRFGLKLEWV